MRAPDKHSRHMARGCAACARRSWIASAGEDACVTCSGWRLRKGGSGSGAPIRQGATRVRRLTDSDADGQPYGRGRLDSGCPQVSTARANGSADGHKCWGRSAAAMGWLCRVGADGDGAAHARGQRCYNNGRRRTRRRRCLQRRATYTVVNVLESIRPLKTARPLVRTAGTSRPRITYER